MWDIGQRIVIVTGIESGMEYSIADCDMNCIFFYFIKIICSSIWYIKKMEWVLEKVT